VLYLWTMSTLQAVGWAICLCFAVCCALRLARFNSQAPADLPSYAQPFFTGVPAPGGAGLIMIPMFLSFEWGDFPFRSPYLSAVVVAGTALLMVSRVPTVSLKGIVRVPHDWVLPTLLGVGIFAGFFATAPWPTLTAIGIVYISSIPLTVRSYYRLRRAARQPRRPDPALRGEALTPAPSSAPAFPRPHDSVPPNEWRH